MADDLLDAQSYSVKHTWHLPRITVPAVRHFGQSATTTEGLIADR